MKEAVKVCYKPRKNCDVSGALPLPKKRHSIVQSSPPPPPPPPNRSFNLNAKCVVFGTQGGRGLGAASVRRRRDGERYHLLQGRGVLQEQIRECTHTGARHVRYQRSACYGIFKTWRYCTIKPIQKCRFHVLYVLVLLQSRRRV